MPNPYREIFRAPGALGFSAAGFIARMPIAMVSLGIVTMISQGSGQYWLAGTVAACFALSNALLAPQISRMVDRLGQSRVIIPATLLSLAGLTGLMLANRLQAPAPVLFACAVLAGAMPSIGAMVRARWTRIYRDKPELRTAFAFESVLDEIIFIIGPIVAIGLSVSVFDEAGPLFAALLLAIGATLFVAQKSSEPAPEPLHRSVGGSVIRLPAMQILAVVMVAIGVIFGTAEVATVAFAEAHGHKGAASLVLASYAAGSLLVGLVFGILKLRSPLVLQLLAATALAAATTLPLLIVDDLLSLAFVLFLSGAAVSPTIIAAMGLIERIVPPAKLTEGITWAMTGIGTGMALGVSVSGWVIDAHGASAGFWISIAGGIVALALMLAGYRAMADASRPGRLPDPALVRP